MLVKLRLLNREHKRSRFSDFTILKVNARRCVSQRMQDRNDKRPLQAVALPGNLSGVTVTLAQLGDNSWFRSPE